MLKHIAFDFDGTLADSVDFCLAVFEQVLQKYMERNAPCREDIYQNFGMNEPGVLKFFIGRPSPEADEEFFRLHKKLHPVMCPETFPGCKDFLKSLKDSGLELSILTGRAETSCQISMEFLGIKEYFSFFQYGDPDKTDKSGQLNKLMTEKQLSASELLYIGDAVSDVNSCRRAGVTCLSAAWAKSARISELEKINPGLVFNSIGSMQKYIAQQL